MLHRTFYCDPCGWSQAETSEGIAARLRGVGLLKRDKKPDAELLAQLLPGATPKMVCPQCGSIGLRAAEGIAEEDADSWQAAVLCQGCRKPIPPERLEALPEAKRCLACQAKTERDPEGDNEPEFCKHCGSLVELRVSSRGGLTRYRRFCTGQPPCRLD